MDESVALMGALRKKYNKSKIEGAGHSLGSDMIELNTVNGNLNYGTTFAAPNTNGTYSKDVQKKLMKESIRINLKI
ncbi:hypothetical protein [Staphylococcus pettenkoferi]|uniref:Uncharacterized protein n=1 Tax=Staphylococcus pettenkoferi TaxID=170573 RepID=A0A9Q4D5P5_9STAP|nr:hypothetical protein [Staphylococcus pettenkoferi]MCY1568772.1 hypothetical protein [Staphylococcus pettenkoferi]MCY1577120.1 hypothetical protein [Staphylococcus pettenkoferi]MCY1595531.1 hypothetical protein [Staphylococcus pettenkoferi]MCY1617552.1 hypothetical protein [Staphylococcus pettenkoferi]